MTASRVDATGDRRPEWGERLFGVVRLGTTICWPGVVLFGPRTDSAAHAEARAGGLGLMWARSNLLADLTRLFG